MDHSPKQEARTPEYQRSAAQFPPVASAPPPLGHSGPQRSSTHQPSSHRSSYSPHQDSRAPLPSSRRQSFGTINSATNGTMAAATSSNANMVSRSYANMVNLSLNLQSPSTVGQAPHPLAKDFPCICTPTPKVPRPRNAFILYRQRHQADIAAQNPGLSNPELSKIIGGLWKDESEEVRDQWKNLAEEEKLRHQRQYPDYRYQPRRGGRASGNRSATEDPSGRCVKCGGRLSTMPHTPQTSFPPMGPNPTQHSLGSLQQHRDPHDEPQPVPNRPRHGPSLSNGSRSGFYEVDDDGDMLMSPENMSGAAKRRRTNNGSYTPVGASQMPHVPPPPYNYPAESSTMMRYPPPSNYASSSQVPPHHGQSPVVRGLLPLPDASSGNRPMASAVAPQAPKRRPLPSFPEPAIHGHSAPMPAPPSESHFDASLKLPPLKTQIPMQMGYSMSSISERPVEDTRSVEAPAHSNGQERSQESMILAIPDSQKYEMINNVSSTLRSPPPGSSPFEVRGPFVAIEGEASQNLLDLVSAVVRNSLANESDMALKTWSESQSSNDDVAMAEANGQRSVPESAQEKYKTYLSNVTKWHEYSREMVKHITTKPRPSTSSAPDDTPRPIKRRPSSETEDETLTDRTEQTPDDSAKIPVALVTGGFRITLATRAALRIPIEDAYTPTDHYQWMASIWRCVIGPDLTVNVLSVREEDFRPADAFEVVSPNMMVVRAVEGQRLDEAASRRLAFEVAEWVRSGCYSRSAAAV
ncbi:hypothetical protein BROUX41_005146 [Berkeleyomyces rouxiae]